MSVIANLDLSGASAGATANPGGTIPAVFTNKTSLKSFKFPANVRNIAANAFTGSGLTGIFTIPATVNTTANINNRVVNCPGITAFAVEPGSTTMKAVDGVLFDITGATLALYPGGKPGSSYSIPAGTTTVSAGAFSLRDQLNRFEYTCQPYRFWKYRYNLCKYCHCKFTCIAKYHSRSCQVQNFVQ